AGGMLRDVPAQVRVRELAERWPFAIRRLFELPRSAWTLAPAWLLGRRPRSLYSLAPLARYLDEERPDALLATPTLSTLTALFAAQLAQSPVRIVAREANTLTAQLTERRQLHRSRVLPLVREWYPRAAGIVAVSQGVAAELARAAGIPRGRIAVIHNPLDVARIREAAREAPPEPWLTTPGAPPVIVSAGRLVAAKDFATLLRAFARLRAERPARLVILGGGPRKLELMWLARRLRVARDVRLAGHVANPFSYMARARVFALSSRYEGLANVLREALACGCPVVATDCPSGSAEALGYGAHGRLVPVGDDAQLARALAATLDERDTPERAAARAASVASEDSAGRYLELLLGAEA
ncbi:MAG TPA: glycosyltransferase, partial [Myxococcota bacterium]|nr:glycosyltransferase [Myxococcota bacterium]